MIKKLFIVLLFCLFSFPVFSKIGIGSGLSASTAGKTHPLLYGSIEGKSFGITGYSVGANSKRTFHSAYQLNFFKMFNKAGDLLWASVEAGVGWGVHYYQEGIKLGGGLPSQKREDFATGPSIRVLWNFLGPVFLAFEGMYGIRNMNIILLSSQDVTSLILGVRF